MVEQKKLKTEDLIGKRQPPGATTKDGFVGNVGRWQQRLGISVESECSGLEGGAAGEGVRRPLSATVTTAKDLMEDSLLKEAFAARGRHKKSPVLAREVKQEIRQMFIGFSYCPDGCRPIGLRVLGHPSVLARSSQYQTANVMNGDC